VNHGCSWAYRTVLYRKLEGLESAISLDATQFRCNLRRIVDYPNLSLASPLLATPSLAGAGRAAQVVGVVHSDARLTPRRLGPAVLVPSVPCVDQNAPYRNPTTPLESLIP
jgi:glutathionyl-hydroquinone reductase